PSRGRLKGFAETDLHRFSIRIGQHQMEDEMRERLLGNRDTQILHVREIGLGPLAWGMHLLEEHLVFWPMHRPPGCDVPLERPQLGGAIFAWLGGAQQRKQGGGLEGRVALQLLHHPGPIRLKRVWAAPPRMRAFELAWQLPCSLVFMRRLDTYARSGR